MLSSSAPEEKVVCTLSSCNFSSHPAVHPAIAAVLERDSKNYTTLQI